MWPCFDVETHCNYRPLEIKNVIITVTDPDANKFNGSIDRVKVNVWSDTDRKGIIITAFESHLSSGVFEGRVQISDDQSGPNIIHVTDGDTLAAKYIDTTLPIESKSDSLEVTASSFIGHTGPPLERVLTSYIGVFDKDGNQVDKIKVDQQVQIRSSIANPSTLNQTFAYIVQIQGKDGFIESLGWLSGILGPSQGFSPSVSWIPTRTGNYTATVFVWSSIDNPDALSPPISAEFIVVSNSSSQNSIGNDSISSYPLLPLKQFKSGTELVDIKCNNRLHLVVRYQDSLPLCVKIEHIQKMQDRGMDLLLYARESTPKELTVHGLNDSYKIGEKIDFTINFKGNGYACSYPVIFVTGPSGRIVWVSNNGIVLLCDSDEKYGYKELEWKAAELGDLKINNNSDLYRLVVEFNDKTLTKDFWITSRVQEITIQGSSKEKVMVEPQNITVRIGKNETVRWMNNDVLQHKIVADDLNDLSFYQGTHFDSLTNSTLQPGQQFEHSFVTPGLIGYHIDSGYHGTITVLPPINQKIELQIQHQEPPPFEHNYSNDRIAIMKGAKVAWYNIDNVTHTITSKNETFDSGPIPPRTRFTLDTGPLTAGYYDYFDKLNPNLSGGIRVIEPMVNTSYNQILIEKAKETKESQSFLKKYPDAMIHVENSYYDVVKLIVERQVYPGSMTDTGVRSLELDVEFDPLHNVKNKSIICGGPISEMSSEGLEYLKSGACLNPNS